jgi:virginiamycin B lyase
MEELRPDATLAVGGDPDWMAVSEDAVWVSISSLNRVTRLDSATNTSGISVAVNKPCSGLAVGYGSLWIPSCGDRSLVRANLKTGNREATVAEAPADAEGCVGWCGQRLACVGRERSLVTYRSQNELSDG